MIHQSPTQISTGLAVAGILIAALAADSVGALPLPKPRPASAGAEVKTGPAPGAPRPATGSARFVLAATDSTSSADLAAVKEAIAAARKGNTSYAGDLQKTIGDPLARKLVEWAILRSD